MKSKQPKLKRPKPRGKARPNWPPKELLLPSLDELRRLSEPQTEPQNEQFELFGTEPTP